VRDDCGVDYDKIQAKSKTIDGVIDGRSNGFEKGIS
jgi:hypothetical protein